MLFSSSFSKINLIFFDKMSINKQRVFVCLGSVECWPKATRHQYQPIFRREIILLQATKTFQQLIGLCIGCLLFNPLFANPPQSVQPTQAPSAQVKSPSQSKPNDKVKSSSRRSSPSAYSLGLSLLSPTGLSFAKDLPEDELLAMVLGWGLGAKLYVHGDFLKKFDLKKKIGQQKMYYYYGFGLKFKQKETDDDCKNCEDSVLGLRVPVGLYTQLKKHPVNFFGEVSIGLQISPETALDIDIAIGARYRF